MEGGREIRKERGRWGYFLAHLTSTSGLTMRVPACVEEGGREGKRERGENGLFLGPLRDGETTRWHSASFQRPTCV